MSPINAAGDALVDEFEGKSLKAYLDAGGVPTIGEGHTGPEVKLGMTCSDAQARAWRDADLERAVAGVVKGLRSGVRLNDNELAACAVFTFNVGAANFQASSVCRLINRGDRPGAARAFLLWNKARVAGKIVTLPGLARRRAAEAHLFLTPVASAAPLASGAPSAVTGPVEPAAAPAPAPAIAAPPVPPPAPAIAAHPVEETGVSTVTPPRSPLAWLGLPAALAPLAEAARRSIEALEPVKTGLDGLGLSPTYIGYALGGLTIAAIAALLVGHFRAARLAIA